MRKSPGVSRALFSAFIGLSLLAGAAQSAEKRHGLSLIGEPKQAPDFKHFDYVNPDAPKGGTVRLSATGTFDSLNAIPYKGNQASGLGLIYDQLMATSLDEPGADYVQLAEWVSYPDDYSSVTFKIRDEARWHDGKPVTPEDVIFSMEVLKKHNPLYQQYYKNIIKGKKTGDNEVTFTFDEKNNRELPQIAGQFIVLPKHFYKSENGEGLDPEKTWLKAPLGSGPYRVKHIEPGRYIEYERVKDYWGNKLPVNIGRNNVDIIRYEYFKDRVPEFESFKAGKLDYFYENSAKNWATLYNFPALKAKKVIKRGDITLENAQPMQGFILNLRREKFSDRRVRQAFNLMFNFEWMNKSVFYSQYKRTTSYFEKSELAAKGLPKGQELEILETVRSLVPEEVFTTEYKNPVNDDRRLVDRKNLRKAIKLMKEAGWEIKNGVLTNVKTNKPFETEFMLNSPTMQRVVGPYIQMLERLGIKATMRVVDAAQYKRRADSYDYDITTSVFGQSESPGNEQREYWGSDAADRPGSRNVIGIKDPAVDKLIDRIIFAKDRQELIAATRALDRVLQWNHYLVPHYYTPIERIAYWDKFSHPAKLPSRAIGFPTIWWYDTEKAKKIGKD